MSGDGTRRTAVRIVVVAIWVLLVIGVGGAAVELGVPDTPKTNLALGVGLGVVGGGLIALAGPLRPRWSFGAEVLTEVGAGILGLGLLIVQVQLLILAVGWVRG